MHDNSRRVWAQRRALTLVPALLSTSLLASASSSLPGAQTPEAQRQPLGPSETFSSVSADLTVTQGVVSQAGRQIGAPVPPVRYRWQREKRDRYWKTTMTMTASIRPATRLLSGATKEIAPSIVRIEDDGDGTAPRFYDHRGSEVRPPGAADVARSSQVLAEKSLPRPIVESRAPGTQTRVVDDSWIRSLVVKRSDARSRRDEILRSFGSPLGKLRGMDRFLIAIQEGSVEILIDPELNVIREWNLVKKGELDARGSSEYDAGSGDMYLRRKARVERLLPNGSGNRMTTEVELTNVRFESR
jgi:hypothetical protein